MKNLMKLNIKKATGYDGLSTKLIKITATKLVTSLPHMINRHLNDSFFSNSLKMANVSQVFKNKNEFKKQHYRPFSCLCRFFQRCLKVFEMNN